jgi:hypothetical protein
MALLTKLRANPGGQLSPAEVIGRDKQIGRLWGILERQSLVLSAERRMGKTCVVKKMMAEAPSDMLLIYHDLEGLRSPLEFVETVFQDVERYLTGLQRTAQRTRQFLNQVGGAEFNGFKLPNIAASHWKTLLKWTYGKKVNPAIITAFVDDCLTDSQDIWHMSHYRKRIDVYYESDKRPFVLNLLDILAVANQPLQFNDLFNRLKSHVITEDSEMVRDVLTLLQRDHYVSQKSDGYRFRFSLIRRYWRLHRGLAA